MTNITLELQQENLQLLIEASGSLSKLQRISGLPHSKFSKVRRGQGLFSYDDARQLEDRLGLPPTWFDKQQGKDAEKLLREHFQSAGVCVASDNSDEMQEIRRGNLRLLVGDERGAKSALCTRLDVPSSEFAAFMVKRLGGQRARSIEHKLGIPVGWLDEPHEGLELPPRFEDRLAVVSGQPPAAVTKKVTQASLPLARALPTYAGGPIARALLETINDAIGTGELQEADALELLNQVQAFRAKHAR